MDASSLAADVNLVGSFLANEDIQDIRSCPSVDCIVICASQVLEQAERLFEALQQRPELTKTLVLVGGIGHSTRLIYESVARHPKFSSLADEVTGLPEARVLELILNRYYKTGNTACRILIEDQSTNCGSNAILSRKILDTSVVSTPKTCIVVQDPTMLLRTIASFEKAYETSQDTPRFLGCPIFVPRMKARASELEYADTAVASSSLWEKQRFYELIVGEIPRLRDDENGYGPNGKGFIHHIDVPADVEAAFENIQRSLQVTR